MADIRFWGVKRSRVMANILSGVEDTEGKCVQKVAAGKQAHDRSNCKASAVFEEL